MKKIAANSSARGHIVKDIIDISHQEPVYDPKSFGDGIKYHKVRHYGLFMKTSTFSNDLKFPTVSKIPPTLDEVANFIKLVDRIREDQQKRAATEPGWTPDHVIGVHCHYGFNRTGERHHPKSRKKNRKDSSFIEIYMLTN